MRNICGSTEEQSDRWLVFYREEANDIALALEGDTRVMFNDVYGQWICYTKIESGEFLRRYGYQRIGVL